MYVKILVEMFPNQIREEFPALSAVLKRVISSFSSLNTATWTGERNHLCMWTLATDFTSGIRKSNSYRETINFEHPGVAQKLYTLFDLI
jgi:hypothetical protein